MIKSKPLSKFIGDLAEDKHLSDYTDDDINDLKRLLFFRKAVFFEDQHLTKEQLKDLGHRLKSIPHAKVIEQDINNAELYHYGREWHSDRDYFSVLPLYTAFQVNVLPESKLTGATEFADMAALYNFGISGHFKTMLKDLTAEHEYLISEKQIDITQVERLFYKAIHPVVLKTDFENTSVHSLFLNPAHVRKIIELLPSESEATLHAIYERLYMDTEYHYIHRWKEGSLVIWNNRLCNHRGLRDFSKGEVRISSRVVIY